MNERNANIATLPAISRSNSVDSVALRTPPHNAEVEQAILGALLLNNATYEKVGDVLQPEHFYDPVHARIYAAIVTLTSRGQIADPRTLRGMFENDPALAAVGGANYLVDLVAGVITIVNVEDYARLLYDLYLRRQLIGVGEDIVIEAFDQDVERTAMQQIETAEAKLFNLATAGETRRGFVSLRQSLTETVRLAENAFKRESHVTGVTTGLRDIDNKLAGLQRSDLVILAGRPAMGKTALATNMALNAARAFVQSGGKEGAGTAFFSLEMSSEQLSMRMLGEYAGVPSEKIRKGSFHADDFGRFVEATKLLAEAPFYIDDTPALSIAALRTRARRLKRQDPSLGLIVVDYLQLLQGTGNRREENRVLEISEISRGLKALAKELNVPVLALSQLSRSVEMREDKQPQLQDLRESGSIEQDADVVMFVYREEYYHSKAEPHRRAEETDQKFNERYARWQEHGEKVRNIAEVIIAKNRHGPTSKVPLYFDGRFTKFSDLETHYEPPAT